ncbi:hypothetical protein MLD38_004405 [Melastoma candidum]|uniref:Uncharacterized protein n=1 Tax=Melastoma candidum TaxID=119954 RepID=A0ACB9S5Q7_9MYRT|nr:hypothetical protein MLD38_004405 [Melastoma candidum]
MSLLNQLFNRGVFGSKCKTSLTLAISRIKLLQNKRDLLLKQMRKEIAQFLQVGQEAIARIRVEHVIREQNIMAAYDILELFCEFVHARVPIIENQKECPSDLREAIASIIFAAPRCSDVPDLLQLKNLFITKYGKEFISSAAELRPESGVNRELIEKLSVSAPPAKVRLKVLKDIAQEHNLDWDSSNTEAELSKRHEDLLGVYRQTMTSPEAVSMTPSSTVENTINANNLPASSNVSHPSPQAPMNVSIQKASIEASSQENNGIRNGDAKIEARTPSSDILEKARAAIAAAERASAAARAAAELANVNRVQA